MNSDDGKNSLKTTWKLTRVGTSVISQVLVREVFSSDGPSFLHIFRKVYVPYGFISHMGG